MTGDLDQSVWKASVWAWVITPLNIAAAAAIGFKGVDEGVLLLLAALSTFAACKEQPAMFVKRRNILFHWIGSLIVLTIVARLAEWIGPRVVGA